MEPNEQMEATCYNSYYRHGVDEKRRVQIPAKWRPAQPGGEFTLVLWPKEKEGPCLRAYPPSQMKILMEQIASPGTDPAYKGVLKRIIGAGSMLAPLDKVGRICLSEDMAKAAGITDQVMLVGCLDRFEIWSPERYEKITASDAVMVPEAFKLME